MKNRDRFVGLCPQDEKVYPCRVLMENGQPTDRDISATRAAISRENRRKIDQMLQAEGRKRRRRR